MHTLTDEEKVLQEVMHDAEQLALEEEEEEEMEPPMEKGEEEKGGGGQGAEPGSPAALLDDFIARLGGGGWLYCVNPLYSGCLGSTQCPDERVSSFQEDI